MCNSVNSPESKIHLLKDFERPFNDCVVTNGCFDIIHAGHVRYLYEASKLATLFIVGLNSDASVRQLKGPARPIQSQDERALVLAAFGFVDQVVIFDEPRATEFLCAASPSVYVKGGDYTLESLDPGERNVLQLAGVPIKFIPMVEGKSTSDLIERIYALHPRT
jgi:rfaE bifunctional protein nucleotidyltransferase chain/domain